MLVTASQETQSLVRSRGGTAWVWCRRTFGNRGVTMLETDVVPPARTGGFDLFVVGDILVATRLPAGLQPSELHLSMKGRRRQRPVADWDGCIFVF